MRHMISPQILLLHTATDWISLLSCSHLALLQLPDGSCLMQAFTDVLCRLGGGRMRGGLAYLKPQECPNLVKNTSLLCAGLWKVYG